MPTDNVHDKFFKESFSRKETVKGMIQELFPENLRNKINLESLEITNNSFTDETLNEHFADLVYRCEYQGKKTVRISFLFEHKSYQEQHPHLQLLRYILNALEQDKKEKRALTLTIPIVIYYGKKAWKYESLSQYFKEIDETLSPFIPDFDYLLYDISRFSDTEIVNFKNRFLALSLLLLKNSRLKKYLSIIEESLIELMRDIENQGDMNYITSVFVYTLFTNPDLNKPEIVSIFRKVSLKSEQATMTAGESMIKEGRLEGRLEGMALFIKGMLKMGMDAPTIASSFGLSNKEVKKVVDKIQKGLL